MKAIGKIARFKVPWTKFVNLKNKCIAQYAWIGSSVLFNKISSQKVKKLTVNKISQAFYGHWTVKWEYIQPIWTETKKVTESVKASKKKRARTQVFS